MDRVGAGFIAMLAAVLFAMFDLTASLLVLLGFLIFRWAVIAAPILGTVGLLRPASAGLRRLANAVVAAVFNIAIFGTGAAIYLFAVDLIMNTPTLPGWLQVVLVWLCGVVGWLLLRPYRRITQLGGKDSSAAIALGRVVAPPVLPRHAGGREARRRPSRAAPPSRSSASAGRSSPSRPAAAGGAAGGPGSRAASPAPAAGPGRRETAANEPGSAPAPPARPRPVRPRGSRRSWAEPDVPETRRPATRSTDPTPPRNPSRRRLRRRGCAPRRGDRVRRVLQLFATSALRSRVGVAIVLARRGVRGRRRGARRLRAGRQRHGRARSRRPAGVDGDPRRDDDGVVASAPAAAPSITVSPGPPAPEDGRRGVRRRPGSTTDRQRRSAGTPHCCRTRPPPWRRSSRASTRWSCRPTG